MVRGSFEFLCVKTYMSIGHANSRVFKKACLLMLHSNLCCFPVKKIVLGRSKRSITSGCSLPVFPVCIIISLVVRASRSYSFDLDSTFSSSRNKKT